MSAENFGGLHVAGRRYERFDFHRSGNAHFLGQERVDRNDLVHHFASTLDLVLLAVSREVREHPRSKEE